MMMMQMKAVMSRMKEARTKPARVAAAPAHPQQAARTAAKGKPSTNEPEPTVEAPQPQAPEAQPMKANPQPQAPEPQPMKADPQPQAPEPQPTAQASTKQDVPNMSDPWILEALCLDPRVVILTEAKQASPHDCPST